MPGSSVANPCDEWRPAATRCGRFEVSRDGRVRNRFNERELTLTLLNGYPGFATRKTRKGKAYAYKVHHLVVRAFVGPRPSTKHVVNHKDGVKTNNHASNLEWVTYSENSRHAIRLGLQQPIRGEQQGGAKLTDETVRRLRRVYRPNHPRFGCRALARELGVSHCTVSRAISGRYWSHVEDAA